MEVLVLACRGSFSPHRLLPADCPRWLSELARSSCVGTVCGRHGFPRGMLGTRQTRNILPQRGEC